MIVDSSYFKGPIILAQLGQSSVEDNLTDYIKQYEPEFLAKVLGYELSRSFIEGIDIGSGEEMEDKWDKLLNGDTYTDNAGKQQKWNGLIQDTDHLPVSPIAQFVYWHYVRDLHIQQAGTGTVKPENANSTVVSPIMKMVQAWNEMVKSINVLWQFLEANSEVYSDFSRSDVDSNYGLAGYYPTSGYQNQFGV